MKLINQSFPNPILTPDDFGSDYIDGAFECVLQIDEELTEKNQLKIQYLNMLSVDEIRDLITDDYAQYALDIRCAETHFRQLIPLSSKGCLFLNAYELHGKVELTPVIVCTKKVIGFNSEDLNSELRGSHITFDLGSYIAIDKTVIRFLEYNSLSLESLVRVRLNSEIGPNEYHFVSTPNYLYIELGTSLARLWKNISGQKITQPLVAMSIYKDCISYAITELSVDPDALSYNWGRLLEARLVQLNKQIPEKHNFNEVNTIAQSLIMDHGVNQLTKLEF